MNFYEATLNFLKFYKKVEINFVNVFLNKQDLIL